MISQPMLAVAVKDLQKLKYPVLATPKLDGIRCLKVNGRALTRKFKPIPNRSIREVIEKHCPDGFDGEIMIPGATFNEIQSLVMSQDGEPAFEYWVFDYVAHSLNESYRERVEKLWLHCSDAPGFIQVVFPQVVKNEADLLEFESQCLAQGYEGVMIRSPESPYKCGRSTLKEGYLLKLKRFEDSEAEVIGFEEKLRNENEQERNELGYAKRSSSKAGLVPAGTLGALLLRDLKTGVEFSIGSGFNAEEALDIWECRDLVIGRIVTYKFQPAGVKDKPRFPIFKGFRSKDDISD